MWKYEKLVVGEMRTNCYWLWDDRTKETIIVDPGDEGTEMAQLINERRLVPKIIVATHGHRDHTGGIEELKMIFGIPAIVESGKTDFLSQWGLEVIPLPGHTQGSVAIYIVDACWLLSGDSILPEEEDDGRHGDLGEIRKLPGNTLVLPGHGEEFSLASYWNRQEQKANG